MTRRIDLAYVVKKLSNENPKKINLKDISAFLSEHLHFSYVGFLIKGKFYVAPECKISNEMLAEIAKFPVPEHGAWQTIPATEASVLKEVDVTRVAVLAGANGEVVGQMVFGKPTSKAVLEHKDLVEIAMIVSLMGTIIEDGGCGSKS